MLRKVLILPVLCALAVATPLPSPESTTDGAATHDQGSFTDLDKTTDLLLTTDLKSTTDMNLDVTHTSEFSVDFETATTSSVEKASETSDDYTFMTTSFVSTDFDHTRTFTESSESTSVHL